MHRTRRGVLAVGTALLAGCGRAVRTNTVPGGLAVRNRDLEPHEVRVQAWRLTDETPTATPEGETATSSGPPDSSPAAETTVSVPAEDERAVPSFFPEAGRFSVRATTGDQVARATIELYRSIPGPAGADTMLVTVSRTGELSARATQVD